MLDVVAKALDEDHIKYVRLDGTMLPHERKAALVSFRSDKKIRVFLISLHAGGVGLSCTSASRWVFDDFAFRHIITLLYSIPTEFS